jgi:hypothetical protein
LETVTNGAPKTTNITLRAARRRRSRRRAILVKSDTQEQIRMLVATPDEILWKGLEMAYCKKKAEKKTKKKSKDSSS